MLRGAALLLRALDWMIGSVAVALVAATAVVTCLSVFFRYVMNAALPWPEELAGYMLVWMSFAGAYIGVRRGTHISFDVLVELLPRPARLAMRDLVDLILIAFFVFLTVSSLQMMRRLGGDGLETIDIPVGVFMASFPICAAAMVLHLLYAMAKRHIDRRETPPDPDPVQVPE